MNESKLKKLKQVSIGIFTAISMSNNFKIFLLDDILALDNVLLCDNVRYFYLLYQHFFQNRKSGFCSVNNCEITFRKSERSKNDLFMNFEHQGKFSFVFFLNDELSKFNIHVYPILHDSRVLFNHFIKKTRNWSQPPLNSDVRKYSVQNSNVFVFLLKNIFIDPGNVKTQDSLSKKTLTLEGKNKLLGSNKERMQSCPQLE